MLEKSFEKLYLQFRANYYRRMVEKIGPREGSLSATESYCVEIIYLLNRPSLTEFANYLGISVPNATYKIQSLVKKGYIEKLPSPTDKRESFLAVTKKFLDYYGLKNEDIAALMKKIRVQFTQKQIDELEDMIDAILEIMQEIQEEEND